MVFPQARLCCRPGGMFVFQPWILGVWRAGGTFSSSSQQQLPVHGSFPVEQGRIRDGERGKITQGTLGQGKSRNMQEHQGKRLSRALRELGSALG